MEGPWYPCATNRQGDKWLIQMIRTIQLAMTLLLFIIGRVSPYTDDSCDTMVWDHGGSALGVRDVNGSCTEGRVDWRNPSGAIRVSLQLRPIRLQKHFVPVAFESCFVATAFHTSVKLFLDDTKTELKPLAVLNSSHSKMSKELCFQSQGDAIELYIETDLDAMSAAFGQLVLDYDNRRLPVTGELGDMEDCRPCTDSEIIEAVCTSDFVLTGSLNHVEHHHDLGQTMLHINVNRVFRQRHNLFKDRRKSPLTSRSRRYPKLSFHTEHGVQEWHQNEDIPSLSVPNNSQSDGIIFAPHKCGIRKGHGNFLFVGRIRLKRPLLQCAPRLEDFNRVWEHALWTESNMCFLK